MTIHLGYTMRRWQVPTPPAVFVGRHAESIRLKAALERVGVGLLCGVAGVGKSALAHAYAATWGEDAVYVRAAGEPLGILVDDARRQLARGPVPDLGSDDARLSDLARRLDAEPSLLVFEDLHLLPEQEAEQLVLAESAALKRGRLLATSRHRLTRRPDDPDRFELVVEGLGAEGAKALWSALDELYGPSSGFEGARARSLGNPFQLRRAHAGGLDDDPIASVVEALAGDDLQIAVVLTLAERRVPIGLFASLLPGERGRVALRRLVTRLVAEVDGNGMAGLHALFRDALRPRLSAAVVVETHALLAGLAPELGLDRVTTLRERARHLRLAERYDECASLLTSSSNELIRDGAAIDLVRGLEAIGPARLSREAQLALGRGYSRMMQHEQAYQHVRATASSGADSSGEIRLTLASMAMSTGRLAEGRDVLQALLDDTSVGATIRLEAERQMGLAIFHSGDADGARAFVEARTPAEARPFASYFRVMTLVQENRIDAELGDAIEDARRISERDAPIYTSKVLIPMMLAGALARLGQVTEARALAEPAEAEAEGHEDLQTQAYVHRLRAEVELAKGDRLTALELVRSCTEAYRRGGSHLGHLHGSVAVGRILSELGRRKEAQELLEKTRLGARTRGIGSVERALERVVEADLLAQLERAPSVHGEHVSERARAHALEALAAAAKGEQRATERAVTACSVAAAGPGYAVERVLALLARATLARLEGRAKEESKLVDQARQEAQLGHVDADLVDLVLERLGGGRIVTTQTKRSARKAEARGFDVVLDGGKHQLRAGKIVVDLAKKPTLRKLLYAMASRPNLPVSKAELASAIWPMRYDPLRHDGALWVNLRRLRQLLERTKLVIELVEEGYRLSVPDSFVYVDPGR